MKNIRTKYSIDFPSSGKTRNDGSARVRAVVSRKIIYVSRQKRSRPTRLIADDERSRLEDFRNGVQSPSECVRRSRKSYSCAGILIKRAKSKADGLNNMIISHNHTDCTRLESEKERDAFRAEKRTHGPRRGILLILRNRRVPSSPSLTARHGEQNFN